MASRVREAILSYLISRHGQARRGMAWHGEARPGKAWHG